MQSSDRSASPVLPIATIASILAAIAVLVELEYRDVAYTLVFIWALIAIAVSQATQPPLFVTALGLTIMLGAVLLVIQFKDRQTSRSSSPRSDS